MEVMRQRAAEASRLTQAALDRVIATIGLLLIILARVIDTGAQELRPVPCLAIPTITQELVPILGYHLQAVRVVIQETPHRQALEDGKELLSPAIIRYILSVMSIRDPEM